MKNGQREIKKKICNIKKKEDAVCENFNENVKFIKKELFKS